MKVHITELKQTQTKLTSTAAMQLSLNDMYNVYM